MEKKWRKMRILLWRERRTTSRGKGIGSLQNQKFILKLSKYRLRSMNKMKPILKV